jgi:hypothetical protein
MAAEHVTGPSARRSAGFESAGMVTGQATEASLIGAWVDMFNLQSLNDPIVMGFDVDSLSSDYAVGEPLLVSGFAVGLGVDSIEFSKPATTSRHA